VRRYFLLGISEMNEFYERMLKEAGDVMKRIHAEDARGKSINANGRPCSAKPLKK
jgi:hypothetical protein